MDKEKLAIEKGAEYYVAFSDASAMASCAVKCGLILNTVPQHSRHVSNTGHDFKCSKCDFSASTSGAMQALILAAQEENKPFR